MNREGLILYFEELPTWFSLLASSITPIIKPLHPDPFLTPAPYNPLHPPHHPLQASHLSPSPHEATGLTLTGPIAPTGLPRFPPVLSIAWFDPPAAAAAAPATWICVFGGRCGVFPAPMAARSSLGVGWTCGVRCSWWERSCGMGMGVALVESKRVERRERKVNLWGSIVGVDGVLLRNLFFCCSHC